MNASARLPTFLGLYMASILRDLERGELTTKDMSVLREMDGAKAQHKKTIGLLIDYSLQHNAQMGWSDVHSNKNLLPFLLKIDDQKYTLSWAELRDMDRAGFFRREKGQPKYYRLRYYDGPKITADTDLNDEATRDMIVRLSGKNFEILVDWYQMLRYGRWI